MLSPFSHLQVTDKDLNRIQQNISGAVNPISSILFLDGRRISDISIVSGTPLSVDHRLGRQVTQWWVTNIDANATIWQSTSPDPTNIIVLNASANATISIWVS